MAKPLTRTGVDELVVVPFPNCPPAFEPQHLTFPLNNSAHEWRLPAVIATALARPLTPTGVDELVVVPFPNCPPAFRPQHLAVPFANKAHEWPAPALIAGRTAREPARCDTAAGPTIAGTNGLDAFEGALVPIAFVAVTLQV